MGCHVVAVNNRTGKRTRLTASPLTSAQARTFKSKFSRYPGRRIVVVCSKKRKSSLGCGCGGGR